MKKIKVRIKGVAPILFNRFYDPGSLDKGSAPKGKQQREDEVGLKVYRDEEGYISVPAICIKQAMYHGARIGKLKYGRSSAAQYIKALCFITPQMVRFSPERKDYDGVDERVGRIPPKTGGAAIIRRPFLKEGWKVEFDLLVADDRFPMDLVEGSLAEGGLLAGLCDYRPEFGRFVIEEFK